MNVSALILPCTLPIQTSHGGLYVWPGEGRHAEFILDTFELIFVRRSVLRMREVDREFIVQPAETLLLWPGRRHVGIGSYEQNTEFYWVHFHVPGFDLHSSHASITLPQHHRTMRPDRLRELFHRLLRSNRPEWWSGIEANLLMMQILVEAGRDLDDADAPVLVEQAMAYIDANFHRPITAASVADHSHYTLAHLGERFKEATGQTLTEYIQQRRLHESRQLMLETGLSIKEIAIKAGFGDAGYFARTFRKQEGMSPSQYRVLHSRLQINAH